MFCIFYSRCRGLVCNVCMGLPCVHVLVILIVFSCGCTSLTCIVEPRRKKACLWVYDQVMLNPIFSATWTSWNTEVSHVVRSATTLYRKQSTGAMISLRARAMAQAGLRLCCSHATNQGLSRRCPYYTVNSRDGWVDTMRCSRKFCQRGFTFDNVFFVVEGRENPNTTIPKIECWLGGFVIFYGIRGPVLLRNPMFNYFTGGSGPYSGSAHGQRMSSADNICK